MIRRLTRTLRVADGAMRSYVARPDASDAPAVIVLHGDAGLDDDAKAACDALARLGYLAICPDLFWRHGAGTRPGAGAAPFEPSRAVDDIAAVVDAIRRETLGGEGLALVGRGPTGFGERRAQHPSALAADILEVDLADLIAGTDTGERSLALAHPAQAWLESRLGTRS